LDVKKVFRILYSEYLKSLYVGIYIGNLKYKQCMYLLLSHINCISLDILMQINWFLDTVLLGTSY